MLKKRNKKVPTSFDLINLISSESLVPCRRRATHFLPCMSNFNLEGMSHKRNSNINYHLKGKLINQRNPLGSHSFHLSVASVQIIKKRNMFYRLSKSRQNIAPTFEIRAFKNLSFEFVIEAAVRACSYIRWLSRTNNI